MDELKKTKFKNFLKSLSADSSVEIPEPPRFELTKSREVYKEFKVKEAQKEDGFKKLLDSFDKHASAMQKHSNIHSSLLVELTKALSSKLEELGGTITTSYERNKPVNAAGVYKDMINQISAVNESIKSQPVANWHWPQYASVGVRNKNFQNINPAQNNQATSVGVTNATVTTAGTAVQISSTSTSVTRVVVQAHESNSGTLVVGGSTVVAALVGRKGWALYPTNSQEFYVSDLSLLYIDSTVSGDKCNVYYEIV